MLIEFNFEMNLVLLSHNSNLIYIIDFEFGKVYGYIQIMEANLIVQGIKLY